ncbi:hypothetical protein V8D89_006251 [Ganoderma adspersum]
MGFAVAALQWALQGAATLATGLLPLFITSQPILSSLYTFGTGRLIASSLGLMISSLFLGAASTLSFHGTSELPFSPTVIALSHLAGLLFMLLVERQLSSRTLGGNVPDDMELREQDQPSSSPTRSPSASPTTRAVGPHQRRIYLFTAAFVVPEILSGVYLGYAATAPRLSNGLSVPSLHAVTMHSLSFLGQAPIAVALSTTLRAASLPLAQCKRHILVFAAAFPLAALLSYGATKLCGTGPAGRVSPQDYPLLPLQSVTDGMFVYAAIVVRVLISNSRTTTRSGVFKTVILVLAGALSGPVVEMIRMVVSSRSSGSEA